MLEKLPEGIGHALINQRAGMDQVVYNHLHAQRETPRLTLTSPGFAFNARLPTRYTADGEGLSPPLTWDECPSETAAIAIIVEDADSPTPHPLVHAIVVDRNAGDTCIAEGELSASGRPHAGVEIGTNSYFGHGWLPPDPPPGHGEHRYVFQVFALREGEPFSKTAGRREFIKRVLERAIAVGCLIGTYERSTATRVESEAEQPAAMLDAAPSPA